VDSVIDELLRIERRCNQGIALLDAEEFKSVLKRTKEAADDLGRSWSGSWIGYQSRVYYSNFQIPPKGAVFSAEWGLMAPGFSEGSVGEWEEYSFEEIAREFERRAGSPDFEILQTPIKQAQSVFEACKEELEATLDAFLAENQDQRIQELRKTAAEIKPFIPLAEFERLLRPSGNFISHDVRAMSEQTFRPPSHLQVKWQVQSVESRGLYLKDLAKVARQARLYMEKRMNIQGKSVGRTEGTVFIGHGRSPAWRELKELLQDRLSLKPDEFNLESAAGLTTKERLEEMLDSAVFAFLVMTAEDEHADTTKHARENVIHEVGLFQGHLGFRRAIILLEEGCTEFSNIQGIGQIRFPKGNIKAKSEDIRHVLEREGLLKK
jgi:predicted nucleotide-binding protein